LPLANASVDVVTSFHSLEHWHHSPKRLFGEITRVLRPGGFLILATPNAVNLLKRISVPLGISITARSQNGIRRATLFFAAMCACRRCAIAQLHEWNGFEVVATRGRNFIGRDSIALGFLPRRCVTGWRFCDRLIRLFPTLLLGHSCRRTQARLKQEF